MHYLVEKLRNSRYSLAVARDAVPKTRSVNKWTGFRPVAVSIPKVGGLPPSPALSRQSKHAQIPIKRRSTMDRVGRRDFARSLDQIRIRTRTKGASGRTNQGTLTPLFVEILICMAFDFYNVATGRLDPSHETVAAKVGCHPSSVGRAVKAARELGLISWVRRSAHFIAGAWRRRSNTYQFGDATTALRNIMMVGREQVQPQMPTNAFRDAASQLCAKYLA